MGSLELYLVLIPLDLLPAMSCMLFSTRFASSLPCSFSGHCTEHHTSTPFAEGADGQEFVCIDTEASGSIELI